MPGTAVPYRWITGLPAEAQRQIERDFEALRVQIHNTPTEFDAVIDAALTASDPATHRYKNLADLLANEAWTTTLTVGVLQRGTAIVEPAGNSLSGKGDLTMFGITASPSLSDAQHVGWDWKTLTVPSGQQVGYVGIAFDPTTAQGIQSGGVATLHECWVGSNIAAINASVSGASAFAFDTQFATSLSMSSGGGIQISHHFYDCTCSGSVTASTLIDFVWIGGFITGALTISGSCTSTVATAVQGNVTISTSTNNQTLHNISGVGGNLSVTATSGNIAVRGTFTNVTFSGNSSGSRVFQGDAQDGLDFTGPGLVEASVRRQSGVKRATLRGANITAYLSLANWNNPAIQMIGVTDSLVVANVNDPGIGAGVQAYTIDSASARVLFVLGGSHGANFTAASTNAGTHIHIITDADDNILNALVNSGALNGAAGEPGEDGEQGPPGPPGDRGLAGAAGAAGVNGQQGGQGPPGPEAEEVWVDPIPGPPGADGAAGAAGMVGGAITIPYHFSTTTTDADPGDGVLRLDNATQNLATTIRADTKQYPDLTVISAILDTFDDSTSTVKGFIRLVKQTDRTAWLLFAVTSLAAPTGYRNITVVPIASSSASPFANADNIYLMFDRTGDAGTKGEPGPPGDEADPSDFLPDWLSPDDPNAQDIPWDVAWGEVPNGYAQVTSNQTGITTIVDLTGLTVTFVAIPNRIYEITVGVRVLNSTANIANVVTVANGSNTAIRIFQAVDGSTTSGTDAPFCYRESGLSGSITRKLRGSTASGSMTLSAAATLPAYIWVKDVGPAPV